MAKKKTGQSEKPFPRVDQFWEDDEDPKNILEFRVDSQEMDENKKAIWNCTKFEGDDQDGVSVVLSLADFGKPGMQLISGPGSETKADLPKELTEDEQLEANRKIPFMIAPAAKGNELQCPSPACNDTHPFKNAMEWGDYKAEGDSFVARHLPHAHKGRVTGL